jgi:hypothetical protein
VSKKQKPESAAGSIQMQWQPVAPSVELPRPLPLEFTPRQLHYLLQLVAYDGGRQVYKDDPIGVSVITETHTKLLLVQRAYFDDLEALSVKLRAESVRSYRVTETAAP